MSSEKIKIRFLFIFIVILILLESNVFSEPINSQEKNEKLKIYGTMDGPWDYPTEWNPTDTDSRNFRNQYLFLKKFRKHWLHQMIFFPSLFIITSVLDHNDLIGFNERVLLYSMCQYYTVQASYYYGRFGRSINYMEFLAIEKGIELPQELELHREAKYSEQNTESNINFGFGITFRF